MQEEIEATLFDDGQKDKLPPILNSYSLFGFDNDELISFLSEAENYRHVIILSASQCDLTRLCFNGPETDPMKHILRTLCGKNVLMFLYNIRNVKGHDFFPRRKDWRSKRAENYHRLKMKIKDKREGGKEKLGDFVREIILHESGDDFRRQLEYLNECSKISLEESVSVLNDPLLSPILRNHIFRVYSFKGGLRYSRGDPNSPFKYQNDVLYDRERFFEPVDYFNSGEYGKRLIAYLKARQAPSIEDLFII